MKMCPHEKLTCGEEKDAYNLFCHTKHILSNTAGFEKLAATSGAKERTVLDSFIGISISNCQ